ATQPVVTVPANVTASKAGPTASVVAQGTGSTYTWTLSNGGTITAGQGTRTITWTAPASGTVTASCTVANALGDAAPAGTANSTVVAAATQPTVTVPANVTASKPGLTASVVAQAAGSTYTWSLSGGSITAGQGTRTITWTAPASGTVTASCTVANVAGDAAAAGTANSTVVAAATQPTVTVPANVTASKPGLTASVVAQAAGSTYTWSLSNGGIITAGQGTDAITWTAPASGTVTASCTVANVAGDAAAAGTADSTVVAAPHITSFSPVASRIVLGGTASLTATFTGGTGSVNQSVGTILGDATPASTLALSTTTVFTLTVTNAAMDTDSLTTTVTVGNDLTVNITGLGSLTGDVTVTGPNSFNQHLTANQTFNGLADGTYTITSATVTDAGQPGLGRAGGGTLGAANLQRYPEVPVQTISLTAAATPTGTVTANYPPATLSVMANGVPIDLVLVPAGAFTLGEQETTIVSETNALPAHGVTIAKAFYVAKTLTTQAQWLAVMGINPSANSVVNGAATDDLTRPVETVSFNDITTASTGFVAMLNAAATAKPSGSAFRLPTEAEFEYALRSGSAGADNYFFGSFDPGGADPTAAYAAIDSYIWSNHNTDGVTTQPVAQKLPNAWGLYDMAGQVWQAVQDDWHANYGVTGAGIPALPVNGTGWVDDVSANNLQCSYRGGAVDVSVRYGQTKIRGPYAKTFRDFNTGFRLVLQLP
ncbi:MAG: SUMF1/EgtB/PvdO family nonheme iron enzyme, partial [Acidobacteria bacterium]|nr:SUMF1/EgtB/PvdO family nonheme iron enzyme [Acidobacteriota bacterium]